MDRFTTSRSTSSTRKATSSSTSSAPPTACSIRRTPISRPNSAASTTAPRALAIQTATFPVSTSGSACLPGRPAGNANVNVARLFNVAGSEVILLEDGTPAVRTVLNWVVAAPFVGSALDDGFRDVHGDRDGRQRQSWVSPRVRSSSPALRPTASIDAAAATVEEVDPSPAAKRRPRPTKPAKPAWWRRRDLTSSARAQAGAPRLRTPAADQAGKAGLVAAEGLEPTRGVTPGRF